MGDIQKILFGIAIAFFVVIALIAGYSNNDAISPEVKAARAKMGSQLLTLHKGDFVETTNGLKLVIRVKENDRLIYLRSWTGEPETELRSINWLSETATHIIRPADSSWADIAKKFLTE